MSSHTRARSQLAADAHTPTEVFVFCDEINACAHVGLLGEVLVERSLHGRRIHDGIHVLAACNPYRRRPEHTMGAEPGLIFPGTGLGGAGGGGGVGAVGGDATGDGVDDEFRGARAGGVTTDMMARLVYRV